MKKYLLVLYLIVFIACEELSGDEKQCADAKGKKDSKDTCWNVKLQNEVDHCCFSYLESSEDEGHCEYIEAEKYDIYSNSKSYALNKETEGFYCYNSLIERSNEEDCKENVERNYKIVYECKGGKATVTSEMYSFEDSEKEILKKENHCLTYFYKLGETLNFTETKKSDCTEAPITKQAKDKGITCGFYELVYKIKNKEEDFKMNFCYLLDPESIKNEEKVKKDLKEMALGLAEGEVKETDIETIDISVSDGSGNSISYDTKSGTLTNNNKNNSQLISFSKLLFLLVLISL